MLGEIARGAAGLGPDDDEFRIDILHNGFGAVGDGGGAVMDHLEKLGVGVTMPFCMDIGFGVLGDFGEDVNRADGIFSDGGFTGEHDGVGGVEDGVGDVGDLGAGG